jgi:YbbR domain-containing protein
MFRHTRLLPLVVDNLAMLFMAVALALFVWVSAVREANPLQQTKYQLPVQLEMRPGGLLLNNPVSQVEIRVEAPENVLRELSSADFSAVLDLGGVEFGQANVPIEIRYDQQRWGQVRLLAHFPEESEVVFDQEVTRQIPVLVEVQGDPAPTHRVAGPAVAEPDVINVTGPATLVNPIREARATVFLLNARETRSIARPLTFYDTSGGVVGVNAIDPRLVTAQSMITVPIEQRAGVADVAIQVDWIGRPAENHRFLSAIAQPRSVLVTGPPDQVANLLRVRTAPIDISGLRETTTFRVELVLPNGIVRSDTQPILVEVEIEPIYTTDVVTREPRVAGLRQEYTAELSVSEVTVVLYGPLEALQALMMDDVRVEIDLFGKSPGEYQVTPQIDVSVQSIEVREVRPDTISVTISESDNLENE